MKWNVDIKIQKISVYRVEVEARNAKAAMKAAKTFVDFETTEQVDDPFFVSKWWKQKNVFQMRVKLGKMWTPDLIKLIEKRIEGMNLKCLGAWMSMTEVRVFKLADYDEEDIPKSKILEIVGADPDFGETRE